MEFPESALVFAPSIITLIFNHLEPSKISNSDETKHPGIAYDDLILQIDGAPSNTVSPSNPLFSNYSTFLKLIILFKNISYTKKYSLKVNQRFSREEDTILKKCNFKENEEFRLHLHQLKSAKEKELAKKLFSMENHNFFFNYSVFDIFTHTYENQQYFEANGKQNIDAALSILHLNAFTKWFDALILINEMPFAFRKYSFLDLKLLSIYPKYRNIIAAFAQISDSDLDRLLTHGNPDVSSSVIKSLFYQKANTKLSRDELPQIFKDNVPSKVISTYGINPIYKWICLLDNETLSEEYIEEFDETFHPTITVYLNSRYDDEI